MGQVTASYRRVFQVRPYETETVELSITDDVQESGADALADLAVKLHDALARVGDDAVVARMAAAPVKVADDRVAIKAQRGDPWSVQTR